MEGRGYRYFSRSGQSKPLPWPGCAGPGPHRDPGRSHRRYAGDPGRRRAESKGESRADREPEARDGRMASGGGERQSDRGLRIRGERSTGRKRLPAREYLAGRPLPDRRLPARLVSGARGTQDHLHPRLQRRRGGHVAARSFAGSDDRKARRGLARHGHAVAAEGRGQWLLPRRVRPDDRSSGGKGVVHVRDRPRAAGRPPGECCRPGSRQHLAGLRRLGRQEPVRQPEHERPPRQPRLVRTAVRLGSGSGWPAARVGVSARSLARAIGLRRFVPDGRRHGRRPTRPSCSTGS